MKKIVLLFLIMVFSFNPLTTAVANTCGLSDYECYLGNNITHENAPLLGSDKNISYIKSTMQNRNKYKTEASSIIALEESMSVCGDLGSADKGKTIQFNNKTLPLVYGPTEIGCAITLIDKEYTTQIARFKKEYAETLALKGFKRNSAEAAKLKIKIDKVNELAKKNGVFLSSTAGNTEIKNEIVRLAKEKLGSDYKDSLITELVTFYQKPTKANYGKFINKYMDVRSDDFDLSHRMDNLLSALNRKFKSQVIGDTI